jgi:hypothetical protein
MPARRNTPFIYGVEPPVTDAMDPLTAPPTYPTITQVGDEDWEVTAPPPAPPSRPLGRQPVRPHRGPAAPPIMAPDAPDAPDAPSLPATTNAELTFPELVAFERMASLNYVQPWAQRPFFESVARLQSDLIARYGVERAMQPHPDNARSGTMGSITMTINLSYYEATELRGMARSHHGGLCGLIELAIGNFLTSVNAERVAHLGKIIAEIDALYMGLDVDALPGHTEPLPVPRGAEGNYGAIQVTDAAFVEGSP